MIRPSVVFKLAVALAAPLALCSCGGLGNLLGGGSYQGSWSGSASGNGVNGSMNLSVDQNNNVSGTDTISKPGFTTVDTGSISGNGNMTLSCAYGGVNVASISAAVIVAANSLSSTSGTISVIGGSSTTFSMNLTGSSTTLRKPQE